MAPSELPTGWPGPSPHQRHDPDAKHCHRSRLRYLRDPKPKAAELNRRLADIAEVDLSGRALEPPAPRDTVGTAVDRLDPLHDVSALIERAIRAVRVLKLPHQRGVLARI